MNWAMNVGHRRSSRSKVWTQFGKAYKIVVKKLQLRAPRTHEEANNVGIWFGPEFTSSIHPIFIQKRAAKLVRNGCSYVRDFRNVGQNHFLSWTKARERFCMLDEEEHKWNIMIEAIQQTFGGC